MKNGYFPLSGHVTFCYLTARKLINSYSIVRRKSMKTNGLYALLADKKGGVSLYSKLILVSVIIALMFAYVPAASVLAAPSSDGDPTDFGPLRDEWKTKLRNLRVLGTFYERVRLLPTDFEDPDDRARGLFHENGQRRWRAVHARKCASVRAAGYRTRAWCTWKSAATSPPPMVWRGD